MNKPALMSGEIALPDCVYCNDEKTDCWVWVGNTTSGEFYDHMHFGVFKKCPFCQEVEDDE